MDIDGDCQIPIILGRPFLATVGAIIDVKRGNLTFEVGDEKIEFVLEKLLKNPSLRDYGYLVDLLSECVQENPPQSPPTIKLKDNLLECTKVEKVDTQAKGYEEALGESISPLTKEMMCILRNMVSPRTIRLV